jgi:PAS domain S-box-containing protein
MDDEITSLIFESISEGVFTTDKDCRITSFNPAASKISGFSSEEAVGQYCFDIFRTDLCHTKCALKNTLEDGEPISNTNVTILTRDGRKVPISVSTSILLDKNGGPNGAVELFRDLSMIEELRKQIQGNDTFQNMISRNREMQEIFNLLPDIAESECSVLIQGPSGSGKELVAKSLHKLSPRKDRPYIRVNCAALPETLLESELFGFLKGAFTDAKRDKPGRFLVADKGTLLLDEIGDMPLSLQAKLLRVLQDGEIQPLGSTKSYHVDVRIVASTHQDLLDMISDGTFREDLFYRLKVIQIEIPPLHDRKEDIPILAQHFIKRLNARQGKEIRGVTQRAMNQLMNYSFPGNVRELENAIEHAFVLCKEDLINVQHLPRNIIDVSKTINTTPVSGPHNPIERSEIETIRSLLDQHGWDKTKVADILGIHRTTLWRKMKKLKIEP